MEVLLEVGALVIGLTAMVKSMLPERFHNFMPLVAVLIGIGVNWYSVGMYDPYIMLEGAMYGLTATGLYKVGEEFKPKP